MLGAIYPGGARVFCVNGPFGWPCGQQILPMPKKEARPVLEKDIQRGVMKLLELQPDVVVLRQSVGLADHDGRRVMHGNPGQADLTVVIGPAPAIVEFWEIKTPTGRQSPMQVKFQQRVEKRGAAYRVIRSVEDAKAAIAHARMRRVG
jgi:hypothetical protein